MLPFSSVLSPYRVCMEVHVSVCISASTSVVSVNLGGGVVLPIYSNDRDDRRIF